MPLFVFPLTSSDFGAWTSYTPSLTSSAGAITTVANRSGKYVKIGKTCWFKARGTITTAGAGAGGVAQLTTPFPVQGAGELAVVPARNSATGVNAIGVLNVASDWVEIFGSVVADGGIYYCSGVYETE